MPSLRERVPDLCRVLQGVPPAPGELSQRHRYRPHSHGARRLSESNLSQQPRRRVRIDVSVKWSQGGKGEDGGNPTHYHLNQNAVTTSARPGRPQQSDRSLHMPGHRSRISWRSPEKQTCCPEVSVKGQQALGRERGKGVKWIAPLKAWYVPASDKMTALEVLDKGLGRGQTNEHIRVEVAADTRLGRPLLDVPRRRRIHRGHRHFALRHCLDDGWERFPDFAREAEPWKFCQPGNA